MKIIVAVTGASGALYAARLLEVLKDHEVTLLVSKVGAQVYEYETGKKLKPDFDVDDLAATPASGSAGYDAMVIVPCSMKTLASISHGITDNLISRSADVILKQDRTLIVVPRETPLNLIHIRNMATLREAGGVILPACPGFYHKPKSLDESIDFIVGKILESLRIEHDLYEKWQK